MGIEELISTLITETKRNTEETRRTNDRLIKLNSELKTRNELDSKTLNWCQRIIVFQMIIICVLAGVDVAKIAGFLP